MKTDLSSWALDHKKLIYFFIAVLIGGGLYSVLQMSKLEDPQIRVKQAMIVVTYPGASPSEVELQVADPLEKCIRSLKAVSDVTTECYNDLCIMTVELYTTTPDSEVEQCWDQVRRKAAEAATSFPTEASQPVVRDDIDTMFGLFFALTGDGMEYRQLSDYAELIKRCISNIDGVTRIDIYGMPQQCIDITLNKARMDNLGVMPVEVLATLNGQNQTVYSGYYVTDAQRLRISVEDKLRNVEDIRRIVIQGHDGEQLTLGDIATVEFGYAKPVRNKMIYDGQPALGICVGTKSGMDVLKIGKEVERELNHLSRERFPAGLECQRIFYQPECVQRSLGTFAINLVESILIVVLVLMLFMGIRSALIIGVSLLITVVGSFVVLYGFNGAMQRVSLASFVLAMGMLVDNAIVIIDGILVDLDPTNGQKLTRRQALTLIGKRTAMPLLGATLIAILAFLPIFLSPDTAGVYVRDLFIVLAVSLLLSWVLALLHVPLMADRYLKVKIPDKPKKESAPYHWLASVLEAALHHRAAVLIGLVALLGASLWSYKYMKQGFFPDMDYDQLYIEYRLPLGANPERVENDLRQMETLLRDSFPQTQHVTISTGGTPCRYNLVRNFAKPSLSYGELIVDFDTPREVVELADPMQRMLSRHFPQAYVKVKRYNLMYKQYPIEAQFSGPDPAVLHQLTDSACAIMDRNPMTQCVTSNWEPRIPTVAIDYNQADARRTGLTRQNVALSMLAANEGIPVSTWHEGIHPHTLYLHVTDENGQPIDNLNNVSVFGSIPNFNALLTRENITKLQAGKLDKDELMESAMQTLPVLQLGEGVSLQYDEPVIVRFNGLRAQRAQCSPASGIPTEAARREIEKQIKEQISLPEGYSLQWQGEKAASSRAMKYLFNAFPLAIILIIGILICLFHNYAKPAIILACLPFMFIGIVPTMILSGNAFTFVAIVGALGLMGMLIKNGIVLVDEIDLRVAQNSDSNEPRPLDTVLIDASKSRLRPVMMASLTTVLGMIPLLGDSMFGSLAACIMGGLSVGSIVILVLIPVLYSIAYKKKLTKK